MSRRSRDTLDTRIDERLARLLEVERRVEARVRAAEQEARARVATAQEAVRRAGDDGREALEAAWVLEDAQARACHAETMRRLETEGEASLVGLAAPSPERIERLARRALELVVRSDARCDVRRP